MASAVPAQVLAEYGLAPDAALRRLGGTKNANYCADDGVRRLFLRRRHADYCAAGWVCFDHAALLALARQGAPMLAPIVLGDGRSWVDCEGATYEAFPWIETGAWPPLEAAVPAVGRNLARLHRAGRSVLRGGSFLKGGHARAETAPERLYAQLQYSTGLVASGAADPAEFLHAQVVLGAQRLDDVRYRALPTTLVHGDVQPANVLFAADGRALFVDYDWLSVQPVIYDLATTLLTLCTERGHQLDGGDIWSLTAYSPLVASAARALLRGYEEEDGPLSDDVFQALVEQVRLRWAAIRINGARKVPAAERPSFLGRDLAVSFARLEELPALLGR